jgi:hypothetical protein
VKPARNPSAAQLRCGEAASWGARPGTTPSAAARPKMQLRSWKRIDKAGSPVIGFAGIALPVGGGWLEVDDLPVLTTSGKTWAAWPAKPLITREGQLARLPGTSKVHYVNILRWSKRETATRFSQAVVELVRQRDPSAFERDGS